MEPSTHRAVGVDVTGKAQSDMAAALALAKSADVVVLAVGIAKSQEHEGMDRGDTLLPAGQLNFSLVRVWSGWCPVSVLGLRPISTRLSVVVIQRGRTN